MIPELRNKFNSEYKEEKYLNYQKEMNSLFKWPCDFRLAETPLFLSDELKKDLLNGCEEILAQLMTEEFKKHSAWAVPPTLNVPHEDDHPLFLQIDFGICKGKDGKLIPKLIELQGFPSLYGFQVYESRIFKKHFGIGDELTAYFSGLNENSYTAMLKETILAGEDPENVILLEIHPEQQKTRIDFAATESLTGIRTVCLTEIKQRGKDLFYLHNGKEIQIKRIYNRVIFDELLRKHITPGFKFTDELNVKWAGHPNWFFKISKHTLPFLKGKYVPRCFFLNEISSYPPDLENFVLKPLYSFAGSGVVINVTKKELDSITDGQNYILQEKVEYAPLIKTPDEFSKAEVRMMVLWKEKPVVVNNLVRLSKGKMMGVDFNKNKTWVGSSFALHKGSIKN